MPDHSNGWCASSPRRAIAKAYRHGLLEHSLTVAQSVSAISATFGGVDRDVAVTGALLHDGEVGRYHRPLFGPYVELKTQPLPDSTARAGVDVFGGSLSDPSRVLTAVPAHEELRATDPDYEHLVSAYERARS